MYEIFHLIYEYIVLTDSEVKYLDGFKNFTFDSGTTCATRESVSKRHQRDVNVWEYSFTYLIITSAQAKKEFYPASQNCRQALLLVKPHLGGYYQEAVFWLRKSRMLDWLKCTVVHLSQPSISDFSGWKPRPLAALYNTRTHNSSRHCHRLMGITIIQ